MAFADMEQAHNVKFLCMLGREGEAQVPLWEPRTRDHTLVGPGSLPEEPIVTQTWSLLAVREVGRGGERTLQARDQGV